jgi:hypothetical protein
MAIQVLKMPTERNYTAYEYKKNTKKHHSLFQGVLIYVITKPSFWSGLVWSGFEKNLIKFQLGQKVKNHSLLLQHAASSAEITQHERKWNGNNGCWMNRRCL